MLAAATGPVLHIRVPFPEGNLFLELMFLRDRRVFLGFKHFYIIFLYTTPLSPIPFCSPDASILTSITMDKNEFNGDPAATDSTRAVRLPGFANKKYDEDFRAVVRSHTDRTTKHGISCLGPAGGVPLASERLVQGPRN